MIIDNSTKNQVNEKELLKKSVLAGFTDFGKKYFQAYRIEELSAIERKEEFAQFYKLPVPDSFNEQIINYRYAQEYWTANTPLILKLETYFKQYASQKNILDYFNYIKEYYKKWTYMVGPKDKKFYAISTLNLLKQDSNKNFILNLLLQATILIFEESLFAPSEAEIILNKALALKDQLQIDEHLKENLEYIILIYYGFLFLANNKIQYSNQKFKDALTLNPNGVNAHFYLALTNAKLDNSEDVVESIETLYEYDQKRIAYSVEQSNFNLFVHFVRNPITANFFEYEDFIKYKDLFVTINNSNKSISNVTSNSLSVKLSKLKNLGAKEFYNQEILNTNNFLQKVIRLFQSTNNTFVLTTSYNLVNKFEDLVDKMQNALNNKINNEINNQLKFYKQDVKDKINESEKLKDRLEKYKKKLEKKSKLELERITNTIANIINDIEQEIIDLDNKQDYSPKVNFNNSMTYVIMFSFLTFLISGFLGYVGSNPSSISELENVLLIVLLSGLKWSVISTFIGTIIAFLASLFTIASRSSKKQELLKEITLANKLKEREINRAKLLIESKRRNIEISYKKKMENYSSIIKILQNKEKHTEQFLRENISEKYKKVIENLDLLKE